jgi:hypothetical protein
MKAKDWHWRRLTDEQLEAAAVRWTNLAGAAYYQHQEHAEETRSATVLQIIGEIDRRCSEPRLFEDRPGYGLFGA